MQYSGANFSMGAADEAIVNAAANAPVTKSQAQAAKVELAKMRGALKEWLKFRGMNDQIAQGKGDALPTPLLKKPGSKLPPAAVMALRLRRSRLGTESELALQLHQLLSEVFDASSLPNPDVAKNPTAAVELAQIAISGALPSEAGRPDAQGFIWMWPLVVVVGAIAIVIMTSIRSSAETAQEQERLECIKAGKCTDSGFWIKVGAVAVVGWLLWDKAGVGARVKGAMKSSRGRRR